jgi:hypothetical protein
MRRIKHGAYVSDENQRQAMLALGDAGAITAPTLN